MQELFEENDDVSQTFDESDEQLAKMDAELEDERKRRLLTGASEAEVDVAMNELRRQQEAKRKVCYSRKYMVFVPLTKR